jgi:hypothetical protein
MLNSINNKKMSLKPKPIQEQQLPDEQKIQILSHIIPIHTPRKLTPQFCVDGRMGKRVDWQNHELGQPSVQSLGGSLHPVILNWILKQPESNYDQVADQTFIQLQEKGYRIGMHTDSHADGEKSGCGLADNLGKIIKRLETNSTDIWTLLIKTDPSLANEEIVYQKIIGQLKKLKLETIPSGHQNVFGNKGKFSGDLHSLEGDHKEIAAVINTKPNTTLDVDNNQDTQAFNLDLWWVLEQAQELEIDQTEAKLLSLGLYVATEMILVEDKRGIRLPIVVNS